MKLMTLNTHSLIETDYEQKLRWFVEAVVIEKPDVIALQEVSQSVAAERVMPILTSGYVPCHEDVVLRRGNHIMRAADMLYQAGLAYHFTWLPIKLGYGIYEEGLGILSLSPIEEIHDFYVSEARDFMNWRSRKALGIRVMAGETSRWFYSVHMGWWQEEGDSFLNQWQRLKDGLSCRSGQLVHLMGDFNNPAQINDQGYDHMIADNWYDTYTLCRTKDEGNTVTGLIDGWKEEKNLKAMRIDYILQNQKSHGELCSSKVIFNGVNYKTVSDHYGVLVIE